MKKKCAICGYKFKDKDEVICPECFTARDDNISCNRYTDDLHSHRYGYDEKKSEINNSDNDILKSLKIREGLLLKNSGRMKLKIPFPPAPITKALIVRHHGSKSLTR